MKFEKIVHAEPAAPDAGLASRIVPLAGLALLLGLGVRLTIGWEAPFWFDEAFTGTIAIQPTFSGLIRDCLIELSGPVYYSFIWAWEKGAGASDLALRLPSLIFGAAAPLLILLSKEDRQTRWIWAAITALWIPGIHFASEARSYSLLLLLGTCQVLAFRRLMQAPSVSRAAVWIVVSELLVLTHYHSLLITGLQGLIYLAIHRVAALKTWPAAALFVPAAIWMVFHLPVVLLFASPDVAWQPLLTIKDILEAPFFVVGGAIGGSVLALALIVTAFDLARFVGGKALWPYRRLDTVTIVASLLAIAAVLLLGAITPGFQVRYLTPYIPGLLFGIAVWACRFQWLPFLTLGFFALDASSATYHRFREPEQDQRYQFAWNVAVEEFQARRVKRIFFLVDSSTTTFANPTQYARLGRFFHDRERQPVEVVPVMLNGRKGVDPNRVLLSMADRPDDAILWIYIDGARNTLATSHPPRIERADPRWGCRNYGRNAVFIIGCMRQAGKGR